MKKSNLFLTIAMVAVVLFAGCKKKDIPAPIPPSDGGPGGNIITLQTTVQLPVNLASAGNYVILAGSGVSNVPTSAITGNIGLSPAAGSFLTGFSLTLPAGGSASTSSQVTGSLYASDYASPTPANLTVAKGDLTAAYNDAAGRTCTDMVLLSGNIGGLTLTPGLYKSSGSLQISSGDLTFDAKGNASAIFI
ncbi:MAG: ice-binding family protein, partial [Crocinitomicaceae bacterium]